MTTNYTDIANRAVRSAGGNDFLLPDCHMHVSLTEGETSLGIMPSYHEMINKLRTTAQHVMPKGSKVLLYGSRARGTATDDSDWDLLLLLDKQSILREDFDRFAYPFVLKGWEFGTYVSPQLYTFEEWEKMSITPYYANVEQDKKLVYES